MDMYSWVKVLSIWSVVIFKDINPFIVTLPIVIRTLHGCPSQMNENLLISNSKLTSDSELIWWCQSTNLSSFVRGSHAGCVLLGWPNKNFILIFMYFIYIHVMEHGVTGIKTLYFLKSVKNWAINCEFPIGSWTPHFAILSDVEIFTFDPTLKSHQSISSLIQAYYLIISIPNSKNWKYDNDWRFSFFMAGQKCNIGKIPFSELEAKRPSGTFRKSIFFFIFSTHFIQLFWLRFKCCSTLIFFRPTRKVESMKITAWKPFLGQKTQMKKWPKMAKLTYVQRIIEFAALDIF